MADSKSFVGGMVLSIIACLSAGLEFFQSSFAFNSAPDELRSSSVGLASLPGMVSDGPMARMITFFGCVPVTMKPPIKVLSPVSTFSRVEILARTVLGVPFGVAVGVAFGVAVGVGLGVAVAVGLGVGVGKALPN